MAQLDQTVGFLNLHKPAGITSHDCVGRVRKLLHLKRVGHGGTLDPAATGVLPIALGPATRLLQFLPADKAYRATLRLGMTTTTDDLEGEPLAVQPGSHITRASVERALQQFHGSLQQIPPNYSAVQVQGQRLYRLARSGQPIAVEARTVEVYELKVLAWRSGEFPEIELAIACGPGTYIRAIARDLGAVLGVGGTLAALSRTQSSGFSLEDSLTFADLEAQIQAQTFMPIPGAIALRHLPMLQLSAPLAQRWCWGQKLPVDSETGTQSGWVRIHHEDGRFLGIGQRLESVLAPKVVFQPG